MMNSKWWQTFLLTSSMVCFVVHSSKSASTAWANNQVDQLFSKATSLNNSLHFSFLEHLSTRLSGDYSTRAESGQRVWEYVSSWNGNLHLHSLIQNTFWINMVLKLVIPLWLPLINKETKLKKMNERMNKWIFWTNQTEKHHMQFHKKESDCF